METNISQYGSNHDKSEKRYENNRQSCKEELEVNCIILHLSPYF